MKDFLNLPLNASAHGSSIDGMIYSMHYMMLVLFFGWSIYFIFTIIKFRKKNNPNASYVGAKTKIPLYLVFVVAGIEAFDLIGFSIPLWAERVGNFPKEKDATVVRVVAEQFAWNIHYPGADGVFGKSKIELVTSDNPLGLDKTDESAKDDITTINQLNLPVDKPALIYLSSKDVIHSFGLPVMRVKQDVIPGQVIPVWFTPTLKNNEATPNYEIACAQLCGLGHYRMRGYMTIQSKEDFDSWMKTEAEYLAASY